MAWVSTTVKTKRPLTLEEFRLLFGKVFDRPQELSNEHVAEHCYFDKWFHDGGSEFFYDYSLVHHFDYAATPEYGIEVSFRQCKGRQRLGKDEIRRLHDLVMLNLEELGWLDPSYDKKTMYSRIKFVGDKAD